MMLTMFLIGSLGLGAVLAAGSIIGTWLRYASAWHALAQEMRSTKSTHTRSVTFGAVGISRTRAPVPPPEFRARPYAVRMTHGMFAAA